MTRIGTHEVHPAAEVFPLMSDEALDSLAASIKAYGLWRPVVLIHGKILDGRNRYLACLKAGVEPKFKDYEGPDDIDSLCGYVAIENLDRRDLTPSARALVARRFNKLMRHRKASAPRQTEMPNVPNVADVNHAANVVMSGIPELQRAVDLGAIPLCHAVVIAEAPKDEQAELIERYVNPPGDEPEERDELVTVSIELSPAKLTALRAGYFVLKASVHGEVRAAAALLKEMVPGV
jgi:hypothetical protein